MNRNYSVLMSIYNKTTIEELKLSVESILNQTVPPEEFIIVCDGPIGNELLNLLKGYEQKNTGLFTYIFLEENHGLAYALNEGLKRARNELIARMDSDDISLPERCEKQLIAFDADKELVLLGTPTLDFNDSPAKAKKSVSPYPTSHDEIKRMLRRSDPFAHPTIMYKKTEVLRFGGYDPELRRRQDYDLFSKMVNGGCKAANLSEPMLLYKVDSGNFARIKSKESCQSRILVQKRIYERGECSFFDYAYIRMAMIVSRILPIPVYKFIYMIIKRKEKRIVEMNG